MGLLAFDLRQVADIRETGPDDESFLVEVAEGWIEDLICNQDVRGWPGHGIDFTCYGSGMEMH